MPPGYNQLFLSLPLKSHHGGSHAPCCNVFQLLYSELHVADRDWYCWATMVAGPAEHLTGNTLSLLYLHTAHKHYNPLFLATPTTMEEGLTGNLLSHASHRYYKSVLSLSTATSAAAAAEELTVTLYISMLVIPLCFTEVES